MGTPCSSIILETSGSFSAPEHNAATNWHSPQAEKGSNVVLVLEHLAPLFFPGHSPPSSTHTTSQETKRDSHGRWNTTASSNPVPFGFSIPLLISTCEQTHTRGPAPNSSSIAILGIKTVSQNRCLKSTSDPTLPQPCCSAAASKGP